MIRRPPRSTRTYTLFPYTTLFRSLLIRQDVKKKHGYMLLLAACLLIVHALDIYHIIIPERGPSLGKIVGTVNEHGQVIRNPVFWFGGWLSALGDLIAFVVIGAGFLFILLRNISASALYPHRDPRILESANTKN